MSTQAAHPASPSPPLPPHPLSQVCNGAVAGTPDLDSVTCTCNAGWAGDLCDACALGFDPDTSCTNCLPGFWGPMCTPCANCGQHGSCVGSGSNIAVPNEGQCACRQGWGGTYCGACATGWGGVSCETCALGFWGAACSACPACGPNGACSGNGTRTGTGTCTCSGGWTGPLCTTPPPTSAAGPSSPPVDGGAVAAGVIFGVLGAAGVGVFVYARFFGGGPAVASAWAATRRALGFGPKYGAGAALKSVPTSSSSYLGSGSAAYSSVGQYQ